MPGNSVIRGGYNIAYQRGGMSDFTEVFGSNPGISIDATRSSQNGNLGTLPVLLRSSDLGAPGDPARARVSDGRAERELERAHLRSEHHGALVRLVHGRLAARPVEDDLSAEVRFVHSDNHGAWTLANLNGQRNYNELNIVENKFIDEFRIAQNNLFANIAAGRGNTFAYTGAPGTSPLPIFLAHLNGSKNAADRHGDYTRHQLDEQHARARRCTS